METYTHSLAATARAFWIESCVGRGRAGENGGGAEGRMRVHGGREGLRRILLFLLTEGKERRSEAGSGVQTRARNGIKL